MFPLVTIEKLVAIAVVVFSYAMTDGLKGQDNRHKEGNYYKSAYLVP